MEERDGVKTPMISYGGLADTIREMSLYGETKVALQPGQLLVLGFLASMYLVFATTLAVVSSAGVEPIGLKKLVMGAVFPVGLIAIVIGGAELYTGNVMVCPVAAMSGRVGWRKVLYNWAGCYAGNFVGALFGAYLIITLTNILPAPFLADVRNIALGKVAHTWWENFWRGLACVWLVDLAVYLAGRVKEPAAKFLLVWFPTMTFFTIGFEHSVVNMFLIPAGILAGAPITWGQFLWQNLLPVTLGNTVGGLFMVGMLYWYAAGMPYIPEGHRAAGAQGGLGGSRAKGNARLMGNAGRAAAATLAFTALLPGVAAFFFYVLLEGAPALAAGSSALTPAPVLAPQPFLVAGYFLLMALLARKAC